MRVEFKQLVRENGLVSVVGAPLRRYIHSFKVVGQMALVFGVEILLVEAEFLESVYGTFYGVAVKHLVKAFGVSALDSAVVGKVVYIQLFVLVNAVFGDE